MINLKKATQCGVFVLSVILLASCGSKPNYKASIKTTVDSVSYIFGHMYGKQFAASEIDLNIDAMAKGLQEALKGEELSMNEQEINMFLQKFFNDLQMHVAEKALKEGQDFLEANKKKQGVVTLPSGLQYRIIREGSGAKPSKEDDVDVVYHGTLINGDVFDSSKDRQDTATFNVSHVVPGFSEALTLMNEGSLWEVYIPSELGYGENPNPRSGIKPNSVLIFEIDMVKVNKGGEE